MKSRLKRFTVIYMWDDNNQIGARHVKAVDPWFAFEEVAKDPPEAGDQVTLLACVPGWKLVSAPCEATEGNTCALKDYPGYVPKEDENEGAPQ